ncbi:MAG: polysaccharide deacetylase family protein, partial [candidate division KSB1 bacterium]|nr:polysaccharide deacetylase family protein [candidate division KSB1 bacterium]
MSNLLRNKLEWSARKNFPDIRALIMRGYPSFIYESKPSRRREEIPVFVFHRVTPERFEAQLNFLYHNGYQTLTADELWEILIGGKPVPREAIALTFDDGTVSLWSVAFPLLKKYGFHAISFIIPGCVPEKSDVRPSLEEFWQGKVRLEEIPLEISVPEPLCTWEEIRLMHQSGIIEFQSHTMYHHLIFTSAELVDFINPEFDYYLFGNIHVPVLRKDGRDLFDRVVALGTPIYRSSPRMGSQRRYFDNEGLRDECVRFVAERGGQAFFQSQGWRRTLVRFFREAQKRYGKNGHFESATEQRETIFRDLSESKQRIERHLPGRKVRHLCYPWFLGICLSVALSKEAFCVSIFLCIL